MAASREGSIGPKGVKLGLAHFDLETIEPNWAKRSQVWPGSSWARPILTQESNRAKERESRWVGTTVLPVLDNSKSSS